MRATGALAFACLIAAPLLFTTPAVAAVAPTSGAQLSAKFALHGESAPVMIAAHRGLWRFAPENSMPAILETIASGAEILEIDVKKTKDGVLVLMHDDSVDRTTNGKGNVSDLTFAQIEELRLREGLGGSLAAVTDEKIPTLEAALVATKDHVMINLDKGWPYRDAMYDLAVSTGTLNTAIFKSTAPVAEVEAFRAKDPAIVYSHVVEDANASSLGEFGDHQPQSYELIFDRLTDAQIQPDVVATARATSRVWINSMWKGLAADYTDERSLINTNDGWEALIERFGADVIQTDNVAELTRFLAGEDVTTVKDPTRSFRVQAEDYSRLGKNVGYFDTDDGNSGGAARTYEGVDICNQQGAIVACYTRAGEWLRFDIDVPVAGTYNVAARLAVNAPTGQLRVDYGNEVSGELVVVKNTTSHDAFELQRLDTDRVLKAGAQSLWVRYGTEGTQNFNLDYVQFDRTSADIPGTLAPAVPTITGIARVAQTLTAETQPWGPAPVELSYQWLVDGTAVAGATDTTFVPAASALGASVAVTVTGTKTGFDSQSVTSAATAAVAPGLLVSHRPAISGTARVGKTLKAKTGTWSTGTAFSYRWYANGKALNKSATHATYKLTKATVGKKLSVRVTGKKAGYTSVTLTSASKKVAK